MATPRAARKRRSWPLLLIRNALLWVVPVALLWTLMTPVYNRFLLGSAENLVHIFESPNVTDLLRKDAHFAFIARRDFPPAKTLVHSFRTTDVHFHLLMLGVLFLAVPGVPWKRRMENLGYALLITVFYGIFLIFFYVKAEYATGMGAWSLQHYGPLSRNIYGLTKHLLDLPFKLALPFLLWAGFYYRDLLAAFRPAQN